MPVTRLRSGRLAALVLLVLVAAIGGTAWLLLTQPRKFPTPTVDSTAWPAWMQQKTAYPVQEQLLPRAEDAKVDPLAALNAKLAQLLAACRRELFDRRLRCIVPLAHEQKMQNRR
jgi:hypothetical protein